MTSDLVGRARRNEPISLCTIGDVVHDPGSNGPQDVETYRSLTEHGTQPIHVIVRAPGSDDVVTKAGKVVVIGIGGSWWRGADRVRFAIGAVRVGARLARGRRVDVFAASDPLVSGLVGLLLRWTTGKALLVHLQSELIRPEPGWANPVRTRIISRISTIVARRADMVRCVSRSIARNAVASGVRSNRVTYLPPRVDLSLFDPSSAARLRPSVRKSLGVQDRKVLLFIGTLVRRKGVDQLIRATPRIASKHPDVSVLIVGAGPILSDLRGLADRLGVSDRVTFLGSTTHREVPRLFAAADLFVLPSRNEGVPRVILEAMASGLPVVATNVGGVSEAIDDGKTGFLIPPDDTHALTTRISSLLDDPHLVGRVGSAARRNIATEYEREANIRAYAQLISDLACAAKRRPGVRDREVPDRD